MAELLQAIWEASFNFLAVLCTFLVIPVDYQGETLDLASTDSGFPLQKHVFSCGFRLLFSVQMAKLILEQVGSQSRTQVEIRWSFIYFFWGTNWYSYSPKSYWNFPEMFISPPRKHFRSFHNISLSHDYRIFLRTRKGKLVWSLFCRKGNISRG